MNILECNSCGAKVDADVSVIAPVTASLKPGETVPHGTCACGGHLHQVKFSNFSDALEVAGLPSNRAQCIRYSMLRMHQSFTACDLSNRKKLKELLGSQFVRTLENLGRAEDLNSNLIGEQK